MFVFKKSVVILSAVAGLGLSGCNRSINDISPQSTAPQRLAAAPVQPVQSSNQLPPPIDGTQSAVVAPEVATAPTAPTAPSVTVSAAVEQPKEVSAATAGPVTREAVSGTWNVSSDSSGCRMILAFTKWQSGYRAATRKCQSPELGTISSWDVQGKQVVLMDASGNTVGRLYNSGGERYDGTTSSGKPIIFTRS